jgi:hypothetical protein
MSVIFAHPLVENVKHLSRTYRLVSLLLFLVGRLFLFSCFEVVFVDAAGLELLYVF